MQHQSITQLMRKVYLWQKEHQVRWVIRSQGQRRYLKSTDWERGVFWSCVAAAWRETQDDVYLNGLAEYTLNTGFRAGPLVNFADDQVCLQSYLEVYQTLGCDDAIQYAQKALEPMLTSEKKGREIWWWADALFMAAPTLAAFGAHSQQPAYWEQMDRFWWDAVDFLHDPETGLYYRDKRYMPLPEGEDVREQNGQKVFWARGIGWVLAAIPRLLAWLPQNFPSRERYLAQYLLLAEQVVKYQSADGLWRTSLLDPEHFPEPESSASALFCYALAWGINHGVLDNKYRPVVLRAWQGLTECVDEQGKLGWVQLPAYNPRRVDASHNIDYGAGVFLLAGTEMLNLI
ncbi:glycoside hydrolase family 105 protein [Salmonella enterica]|nr:glycoside hydrolase family 105 protein [Salmonella enterica]